MAKVHVVHSDFSRKHPVTGEKHEYHKGDIIADPDVLADLEGSDHEAHGRAGHLPDHHHAVFPHLPDDHPLKRAAPAPAADKPADKAPAADKTPDEKRG